MTGKSHTLKHLQIRAAQPSGWTTSGWTRNASVGVRKPGCEVGQVDCLARHPGCRDCIYVVMLLQSFWPALQMLVQQKLLEGTNSAETATQCLNSLISPPGLPVWTQNRLRVFSIGGEHQEALIINVVGVVGYKLGTPSTGVCEQAGHCWPLNCLWLRALPLPRQ